MKCIALLAIVLVTILSGCQNDSTNTTTPSQIPIEAVIEIQKLNELEWYQTLKREGYCWCTWFGDTPVALGRCEGNVISPQTATILCPPK